MRAAIQGCSDHKSKITVLIFTALLLAVAAGHAADGAQDGKLFIGVDPRMELLAAVQVTAGYRMMSLITWYDFPYAEELEAYFGPFYAHPAVKHIQRMIPYGFAFDTPVGTLLHYGPPPDLEPLIEVPEKYLKNAGGKENLDTFMDELRDFARVSHFMEFYEKHKEFYEQITARERARLDYVNIDDVYSYYGYGQSSYNIILAPLFHEGGYGPRIFHPDGRLDIFSVQGPRGVDDNGMPEFGSLEEFQGLLWHEFSHSFTNPLVDQYWDSLQKYDHLYTNVADKMKQLRYETWQSTCYEYFVRAVVIRLTALHVGLEAAEKARAKEVEAGFTEIGRLTDALKKYEANRSQYPTLKDFFPHLLDVFPARQ